MAWTLSSQVIHPGDKGDVQELTSSYALQKVLDATVNTVSFYGADSLRRNLNFVLFEDDNANGGLAALKAATIANADVNLTSDQGSQGNVRILKLTATRRQDHSHTYPTYDCVAELVAV